MPQAHVTQLLSAWRVGDRAAFDQLFGVTYDELRRLTCSHLRRERAAHTLSATGHTRVSEDWRFARAWLHRALRARSSNERSA